MSVRIAIVCGSMQVPFTESVVVTSSKVVGVQSMTSFPAVLAACTLEGGGSMASDVTS